VTQRTMKSYLALALLCSGVFTPTACRQAPGKNPDDKTVNPAAVALENERTAIITDTAGVKTEVANLRFFEGDNTTSDLCVDTGLLVVVVNKAQLVSMSQINKHKVSISYDYLGKRLVAEGNLTSLASSGGVAVAVELGGDTDLGFFRIGIDRIRTLQFKQAPQMALRGQGMAETANLVLDDGSSMTVKDLNRLARFYPEVGIVNLRAWGLFTDIPIVRGSGMLTIDLAQISTINLGANGKITITPKRGEAITGKIGSEKDGIDGFVALSEKGRFFVDRKHFVSVTFSSSK